MQNKLMRFELKESPGISRLCEAKKYNTVRDSKKTHSWKGIFLKRNANFSTKYQWNTV